MNPLLNARFTENDLVGLDHLKGLLEYAYHYEEVVKAVFEVKLFSVSRCRDVDAAQRMLDFEISMLELFTDRLCHVYELHELNWFSNEVDEKGDIKIAEEITQKWKDSFMQNKESV